MVTLSSLRQQVETQQGTTGLDSAQVSAISGSGVSVYETLDSLPSTGLTAGAEAFVKGNSRLYVSNGSGWYNTTLVNRTPRWDSGGEPDASYTIADSQTPLSITARAIDSDNGSLINQSLVSDSAQYMVDITNDSSVWTFTPKSADSIGIEVAAGNLTDSNGDFIYTFKWSDGISFISKAVTIGYSPSSGSSGVDWGGDRAMTVHGNDGTTYQNIDYWSISAYTSVGDFGDMPTVKSYGAGASDGSRGVDFCGWSGTSTTISTIDYVDIATLGNGSNFGNMYNTSTTFVHNNAACDGTIAVCIGGGVYMVTARQDTFEYVTVQTTGNAQRWGNLTSPLANGGRSSSVTGNKTYGMILGGSLTSSGGSVDTIEYFTYASQSQCVSHPGTLAGATRNNSAEANNDYAYVIGGDESGVGETNKVEYFSIATTGSSTDWGDLPVAIARHGSGTDGTTAFLAGGYDAGNTNTSHYDGIQHITLATGGQGSSIGNLSRSVQFSSGFAGNAA